MEFWEFFRLRIVLAAPLEEMIRLIQLVIQCISVTNINAQEKKVPRTLCTGTFGVHCTSILSGPEVDALTRLPL